MQRGTGFYKFVSICYYVLAVVFSACFAATALAWILLIAASGLIGRSMIFVSNCGCIMVLSILMGIIMLHIHGGCILWALEKRDRVVYTFHQVAAVLLIFTKICIGFIAQYLLPGYFWLWLLYDIVMLTTSILGIVAFTKIKRLTNFVKTEDEMLQTTREKDVKENVLVQQIEQALDQKNEMSLPQGKRIGLLAIEGDYRGDFFQIFPCEKIVFGTSSQASNILFDDPKISRQHCMVEYIPEHKMYYITDCSTNGTFLNDGTRIPFNTPFACAPKTRFYFGTDRQMFELV